VIDRDAIQTQVVDQQVTIVWGYGGAMRVGTGLALRVGAMAAELKLGNSFAESPVAQHPEGCGAAPAIVGDEDRFSGEINRDIAR
jgi:hypothetical protein